MIADDLIREARRFLDVRETDPNCGLWVEFFQRFCNGTSGTSWCADFVSTLLNLVYYGIPPLPRTQSTITMLRVAQLKKMDVTEPMVGDLFFMVTLPTKVPHHVGIVTGVSPLTGIAGNTSPNGMSSNGTGVYEHPLTADPATYVFVRLPEVN